MGGHCFHMKKKEKIKITKKQAQAIDDWFCTFERKARNNKKIVWWIFGVREATANIIIPKIKKSA